MLQRTLTQPLHFSGVGLHSGGQVGLRLLPAPENTGIVFSTPDGVNFEPRPDCVTATSLATTLCWNGSGPTHSVSTVEHLLAALRGVMADNVIVETEGPELPILDGSASVFSDTILEFGLRDQKAPRRVLAIAKPVSIEHEARSVSAQPGDGFVVDYTIDFPHPLIGVQRMTYTHSAANFVRELASARTFGFLKDVEMMHKAGLARGGSLDNAVVLDEQGVINAEGLRYSDEFVRHKILDFIGDMALLDLPLQGHFTVHCSGHALNNSFLRHLDENRDLYLQEREAAPLRVIPRPAAQFHKRTSASEPAYARAASA